MLAALTRRGGASACPGGLERATEILNVLGRGECRKMVMPLLPDFISSHFGTFITQGHCHKSYFVLGDYAVE